MIKEHLVSASVTNGAECICNPEVLLGTKYGLWDFENEQAPRGALLDLNAAWELFLSRQGFQNVSFDVYEHKQHEVIVDPETGDKTVYDEGDTTYTLNDDHGNPTGATFTIKANKGPVEHIEWENGKLILYYTKQRPLEDKDLQSGAPLHYVTDEEGTVIVDEETGKPLIYDYVMIPVIEIFDNDETRQLFPWYSDDNNVTQLRDSIDGRTGHLGSFAITPQSEVYYSKDTDADKNQDLISLQSVQRQLNKDLGITPTYTKVLDYPDPDDGQYHTYKASGSDIQEVLHSGFGDKSTVIGAINEDLVRTRINTRLLADKIVESDLDWQNLLVFADSIKNQAFKNSVVPNILAALNWMQTAEIGPFKEELNINITKNVDDGEGNIDKVTVENITEALNVIFAEAEENRDRIGYDRANNKWIDLNTDKNNTLTEAINEVDEHTNALADIVQVREEWDTIRKKTYYSNPNLNDTTKNRLRVNQVNKDDITIIEAINELQNEIGNLSSSRSGDNATPQLTTDNKNSAVEAINEVDLHADNNAEVLGAEYEVDLTGKKHGEISNLETNTKASIVAAINELDSRVGEVDDLDTEAKTNIVDAINEVIKEQPLIYENVDDLESGVVLKDQSEDQSKTNHAGKYSLAVGTNNNVEGYSLASGAENEALGNYTSIQGYKNKSKKKFNLISGSNNSNDGDYNLVNGKSNTVTGSNNLVSGSNNNVTVDNSLIVGDTIFANNGTNLIAEGDSINFKNNTKNSIALGRSSIVNGDDAISIGSSNTVSEESVTIGKGNQTEGPGNVAIGDNNYIGCDNSYTFGNTNRTEGDHSYTVGENNTTVGNNNYVIGKNQRVEGDNNVVIGNNGTVRTTNSITIGEFNKPKDNATNIGRDIYIQTHDTESKLQSLIFVDLNDWCRENNAASLNAGKFLDSSHLVEAIKVYKSEAQDRQYSDSAILRFKMQNNENGLVIIQGKSTRVFLNGTWYFSDDIENGWSRHEGEYLKVINKTTVDQYGNQITKHYLALMDQLSTEAKVDTVGGQRSNSPDFQDGIDLTHAYGAVDVEDLDAALELPKRLNQKVDKYAKIITKYQDANGYYSDRIQNFINPDDDSISNNITLSLKDSFGFDKFEYQLLSEKGQAGGYVPLGSDGLIDSQFLPSYVDDVVDVWAEYEIDDLTRDVVNIKLYEVIDGTDSEGHHVIEKGLRIDSGEKGKIYVEAFPLKPENLVSYQFRWTGTRFVAIGAHIVIGTVEGTAFDGGRGKQLEDNFNDHTRSGVDSIFVPNETGDGYKLDEHGNPIQVIYKPNPHHVTPDQMSLTVNDPNDPNNTELLDTYTREYTVGAAIKELFNRINASEDAQGSVFNILGNVGDYVALDKLDEEIGNKYPTLVSVVLNNVEKINSIDVLSNDTINNLIDNNFILNGGNTSDSSNSTNGN